MPVNKPHLSNKMSGSLDRRAFLRSSLAAGAGLFLARPSNLTAAGDTANQLNVAIIGTGVQGRVLIDACINIPDIRFKAVCDIWNYSRRYGQGILRKHGHTVNAYSDYQDMLAAETDIDAVLISSPDFVHAEHTNACLKADLHVYCEKMMSNTHEGAKSMIRTARETGKLLQIGHQRRSNPRYIHVRNNLLREAKLLGRITNANGQWNRAVSEDIGWPRKYPIEQATLEKYGYGNMREFRNWRWFKKYGGGPISDLGAHQIDIFNWFLDTTPKAVIADGGLDYYSDRDWHDNVMAIYEYSTSLGTVRAFYQVLTTTSAGGGYFEYFMGTEGALKMSENPKFTKAFREAHAPEWDEWVRRKYIRRKGEDADAKPWEKQRSNTVDVRETAELAAWEIPLELNKPVHQPHLENFFDAIRKGAPLNCPSEDAYKTEVTVLKVNEAIEAGKKLYFKPEDFVV